MINLGNKIRAGTGVGDFSMNNFGRNSLEAIYGNMVVRNRFIKRVYSILGVQLLVTVGFVLLNMFSSSFPTFQDQNDGLFYLTIVVSVLSLTILGCVDGMSTKQPHNIFLLCLFTLAQSYAVSSICSLYDVQSVLNAAVATLAATLGLTLYAVKTKKDFSDHYSKCYGLLWAFVFVAIFLVMINIFFIQSDGLSLLISIAFSMLYSFYLIVDTQLIMGDRKKQFRSDQYVMGAVMLYIDIVNLFISLLDWGSMKVEIKDE